METDIVLRDICPALPGAVRRAVESMHPALRRGLNEVRLRPKADRCASDQKASTTAFLPTARRRQRHRCRALVVGEAAMSKR